MWKLATECGIAHPYGEEGWRPTNSDYHEHWEPNMVYLLIQHWDDEHELLGVFPSTNDLKQHVETLKAPSAFYTLEWQEWDVDASSTAPKRKGYIAAETKYILPKELT